MTEKNHEKSNYLFKGRAQTFGIWVPTFFGVLFSYIFAEKGADIFHWDIFWLSIGITAILQYAFLMWVFFVYRIYNDRIDVRYPLRFWQSGIVIPFSSIVRVIYEDDGGGIYGPMSVVQVKFKKDEDVKRFRLHLHNFWKKDLVKVLTIFKQAGLQVYIDTRHQKIKDIFRPAD